MSLITRDALRRLPLSALVLVVLVMMLLPLGILAMLLTMADYRAAIAGPLPLTLAQLLQIALPLLLWVLALAGGWVALRAMTILPLRHLQRLVEASGHHVEHADYGSRELATLAESIVALAAAVDRHNAELDAALVEQRRLTREIHHRVKNSLQIISSLLSLHARGLSAPAIIAIADPESADIAGMALSAANVTFLDPEADDNELGEVLDSALANVTWGVADRSTRDFASISALGREVERIATALAALAASEREDAANDHEVNVAQVRALIKARRARDRYFSAELFSDPAWDMMLDLTAARLEGRSVSVSSLCIAAAVPTTTALRWIRNLCDSGIFERRIDPADARRALVQLSEPTAQAMMCYLAGLSGAAVV